MVMSLFTVTTHAKETGSSLDVSLDLSYGEKYNMGRLAPAKITIKNTGSNFTGDLAIQLNREYPVPLVKVYEVEIEQGETKTFEYMINPDLLQEGTNTATNLKEILTFYEGGLDKGTVTPFKEHNLIAEKQLESTRFMLYTLTSNDKRLAQLQEAIKADNSYDMTMVNLQQQPDFSFPQQAEKLDSANVLLIDDIALSDYNDTQQQALLQWVSEGGTVLVGTLDADKLGVLQPYLPLEVGTGTVDIAAQDLQTLTAHKTITAPLAVNQVSLKKNSEVVLQTADKKLLAAKTYVGNGQIIQMPLAIGNEPQAQTAGYGELLLAALDDTLQATTDVYQQDEPYLTKASAIFKSFEVNTSVLLLIIVIYIIAIGPILYYVLKRRDKRGRAWAIIPATAIIIAITIFIIGARDRLGSPQIQQLASYSINDDNSLTGSYASSILTNGSGKYELTVGPNTTINATNTNGDFLKPMQKYSAYVRVQGDEQNLTFANARYWSVQSAQGKSFVPDVGNMNIDLTLRNGKIEGTIENTMPFTLHDVTILTHTYKIHIGDIAANDKYIVSEDYTGMTLLAPYIQENLYDITAINDSKDITTMRHDVLNVVAIDQNKQLQQPIITAWTDEPLTNIKYAGKARQSTLTYVSKAFEPKQEIIGDVTLKSNVMSRDLFMEGSNDSEMANDYLANLWYLYEDTYRYELIVPKAYQMANVNWYEMNVANMAQDDVILEIFNNSTQDYEKITKKDEKLDKLVGDYITANGKITLRVSKATQEIYDAIEMPEITLKGVANK